MNSNFNEDGPAVRGLRYTVRTFYERMVHSGVYRAYIVHEDGRFVTSHPELLAPIQHFLETSPAFAGHEAIFIGREDDLETLFFAFIHNTTRGLAQGGLRFCRYPTLANLLEEGLRLSQRNTRKNALAGLWWGGGTGIMDLPFSVCDSSEIAEVEERSRYFEAYGRFVASLNGVYYTSEDLGTTTDDMAVILRHNRFTTCVPSQMGGSGDHSPYTAQGVFWGMQAAWKSITGAKSLKGVRVAVQGAGGVGTALVGALDNVGAEAWIADSERTDYLRLLKLTHPDVHIVEQDDAIYDLDVDIFSPCADGGVINPLTIPRLKAKLVCGAANNILSSPTEARVLRDRNIAFVPDYICNRITASNCADEWMGYLPEDVQNAAEKVYRDTVKVFDFARAKDITTTEAAEVLADEAARELHPLFHHSGVSLHRGARIIRHLMDNYWAEGQIFGQDTGGLAGYEARI
jgi:glutamate dehydrogenase/leucine dehydrogenase